MHTPYLIAFKENTRFSGDAESFWTLCSCSEVGDGVFVKDVAAAFHAGVAVLFERSFCQSAFLMVWWSALSARLVTQWGSFWISLEFLGGVCLIRVASRVSSLFFFFHDARFPWVRFRCCGHSTRGCQPDSVGFKISLDSALIANRYPRCAAHVVSVG